MRFIKTVVFILCTAMFMTLLPGCGKVNDSDKDLKIALPEDKLFSDQFSLPNAKVELVLYNDGTYGKYTRDSEDNFELLYWEMLLSKEFFDNIQVKYRELAATSTTIEYRDDIPMGTVEDYEVYEGVSYEEYLEDEKDAIDIFGFSEHFDKNTYKLINRPAERVKISFAYHPDDNGNPRLKKDQIIKYYKEGLKLIYNDPELSKYVLESVNLDSFKTGKELKEIDIWVSEDEGNKIKIIAETHSAFIDYDDIYRFNRKEKDVEL